MAGKESLHSSPAQIRRFTLGSAFEAISEALAWPPDASYEGTFADARKALNELHERLSEAEKKRYDAEVRAERLAGVLAEIGADRTHTADWLCTKARGVLGV